MHLLSLHFFRESTHGGLLDGDDGGDGGGGGGDGGGGGTGFGGGGGQSFWSIVESSWPSFTYLPQGGAGGGRARGGGGQSRLPSKQPALPVTQPAMTQQITETREGARRPRTMQDNVAGLLQGHLREKERGLEQAGACIYRTVNPRNLEP